MKIKLITIELTDEDKAMITFGCFVAIPMFLLGYIMGILL